LNKDKVLLNTSVTSIDMKNKKATLSTGESIEYEYLVNTMPLNRFLGVLGNNDDLIKEMSYNKVLVFNLGFDKASPLCTKEHWLYIPSKDDNYYRVGFYNNILNQEKLSMYIEIGYSKDDEITEEEIKKQLDLTLKNLNKDGIISDDMKLVDYMSIIMDPAYVHISTETTKKIEKLKEELKEKNIYTIGRYGAWIYNSMEDSMVVAKELAEKLN
jgi:protoporphyrinogen oxidase